MFCDNRLVKILIKSGVNNLTGKVVHFGVDYVPKPYTWSKKTVVLAGM
jgi:hypothetical protein